MVTRKDNLADARWLAWAPGMGYNYARRCPMLPSARRAAWDRLDGGRV